MRPYAKEGKISEDPMDGPHPTRKTQFAGRKRRAALRRKMRGLKKGARKISKKEFTDV